MVNNNVLPIKLTLGVSNFWAVTVIRLLVAVAAITHVALLVKIAVTRSLSTKVLLVNVLLFPPTLLPFSCHWYAGVVPPSVTLAVKVTILLKQIVFDAVLIVIEGRTGCITVILTLIY